MSDEKAQFEELFRQTRAPLLGYLTRRAPVDDAPDLLAEVYLVAWRRRSDLPRGDERRLWLFGVARRLVAEHHRLTCTRADAELRAGETPVDPGCTDAARSAAVLRALDSLGELDRELVTLTTWEGLSPAEAARVVGITAGTARVRLHRARARLARHPRLRELLEGEGGGAAEPTVLDASPTAVMG
jgi:RNA polymerase sigma-70 factor (ECF subfamily)